LIVGDSIGAAEVHAGLPFRPHSESGVILERAIVSLGFTREQFGLYNVVNCQPPYQELVGAPYEQQTLIHCRQHVDAAVERFQPKVIVAMGALAIRALTGMHGKKMTVDLLQGYALPSSEYAGIRVVACYHPKYIQQGHWEVFPLFRFAIKKAVEIAKIGWKEESLDYREEATIDDLREMWKRLQAEPDRTLSCDFETDGEDQDVPLISLGDEDEDDELGEDGPEDLDAGEGLADIGEAPKKTGKITVFQNITQVNFSDEIRTGLATVYNHQTKPWIQKILATENQKCGHNWWNFDAGVAMYNGLHVGGSQVHDTIWSFHHLQPDLPGRNSKRSAEDSRDKDMGSLAPLQFVASIYGFPFPWKHEFKNKPGWYGCCDVDSDLRAHLGIAKDLAAIICDPATGQTAWDGYLEMVYDIQPIFEEMNRRGIPVNREKIVAFTREMRAKSKEIYQRMVTQYVPEDVLTPRHKLGMKTEPKDTTGYVKRTFVLIDPEKCRCVRKERQDECVECGARQSEKPKKSKAKKKKEDVADCAQNDSATIVAAAVPVDGGAGVDVGGDGGDESVAKKPVVKSGNSKARCWRCDSQLPTIATCLVDCPVCKGKGLLQGYVERWTQLQPFKPSPKQLGAYAAFRGHQIPKNARRKRAMDKENLLRMAVRYKDPLYKSVIEYREFEKMAGTYGLGWMPAADGRAHPSFSCAPATGQSSSTGPNAQNRPNASKIGILAEMFGQCIEAPPGFVLIEADWRSFHAQTLGLEAGDMDYLRLAKLDIHSYLTAHLIKDPKRHQVLAWSDEELGDYLKWIKKNYTRIRNLKAKPAILGYGFGLGAMTMYGMNRDSFNNKDECQGVIDELSGAFPKAAQYREDSPEQAHREKKLVTKFGAVRWFWNAKTFNVKEKRWEHGKDWERAIAFRPASNAFGHKKAIMRQLRYDGMSERWGLINDIHDALLFCCPIRLAEECCHGVARYMRQKSSVLLMPDGDGFWCDVEVKMGANWNDMEEVKV
jgi:uracil-DNA glycosylase family 4